MGELGGPGSEPVAGSRVSRRHFLRLAGAGGGASVAAGALGAATLAGAAAGEAAPAFDREVDVAVVGSGAAGSVAALFAAEADAEVALLEKALLFGGTTVKSGGVYWIPNNTFLRERGIEEPRADTIRKMARYSFPHLYDPEHPQLGLAHNDYELIATLYDEGPSVVTALADMGALVSQPAESMVGPLPDYFDPETGDATPVDRRLWPRKPDGSFGLGDEMVRQLKAGVEKRGIPLLMGHRVTRLLVNGRREVIGVEAESLDRKTVRVRARRGVIFGSGGFTHNPELMLHYQPGPVFGGCAVPTNEGDFVYQATALGAKLGHMHSAWRAQIVLEQALQFSSTPDDVFMPPGDSMVLVNRYGKRVVNETANYNERTRVHFAWDPAHHDWPNMLLFMVYDRRSAALYGGRFPIPTPGTTAPYVITGESLTALAEAVAARLERIGGRTGGFALAPGFGANLERTIARFNGFAASGTDGDFGRGAHLYDRLWHSRIWSYPNQGTEYPFNTGPNVTMHPFAETGPYFCIILAPGTLDTNGGPAINARAEILDAHDRPIPGLYGAGNCVASPTGPYYYGGGGTLGPAMVYGAIAGRQAAAAPVKDLA